jgi:transcriptional regulator with XRE-family HTH domain
VPKISGLMNDEEVAICDRVQEVRRLQGWSQSDFSKAVGITRNQLAGIEYAGNPLRYWLADRICQKFNVCQQWLATGKAPRAGYVDLPEEMGMEIGLRELFSAAYARVVGHPVARSIQETEIFQRSQKTLIDAGRQPDDLFEHYLQSLVQAMFRRVPPQLQERYFRQLMATSSAFFRRNVPQVEMPGAADAENKGCTSLSNALKSPQVKDRESRWYSLRSRLGALLSWHGSKSALAREFNVTPASVSEWLSGDSSPEAETTLRLLEWVQAGEAKQKRPGRAQTRPELKAQARKSHNENQTRDRKRRSQN